MRCHCKTLTRCAACHLQASYLDKSPLVAIEAVSIMAGFGKQFASQHYLGREAVYVPAEFVEALLPGASALLQRLHSSNQQAQPRSEADHSEVYFVEAAIRLAQAFWRALPFKLQRYGAAYLMAQLPAVKAVLSGPQWQAFQQQVLQQHEAMEKQRTQPWAQMVPGLASTLQQLDNSVTTLSAAVQRTGLQQEQEQQPGAAASGGSPELAAGTTTQAPSKRSTAAAIPKLYSNKVATVQEAYQEYWWVHAACKVQVTCESPVCVTGVEAEVCQTWIFSALCCGRQAACLTLFCMT